MLNKSSSASSSSYDGTFPDTPMATHFAQQSTTIGVNCRWFPVPATNLFQGVSTLFLERRERIQYSLDYQVFSLMPHRTFAEFYRTSAHNGNAWRYGIFRAK